MNPAPITATCRAMPIRCRNASLSSRMRRYLHIGEIGVGDVEQAVARTGREHQMAIVEEGPGGQQQPVRGAIDEGGAIPISSMFWSR